MSTETAAPAPEATNPDLPANPTQGTTWGTGSPHPGPSATRLSFSLRSRRSSSADMPCPLCVLQRMAMMLIGIAAIWMVGQARKGHADLAAYARSYGSWMIVAAMLGATMSTRQIELHILPGDAGDTATQYWPAPWATRAPITIVVIVTAPSC